VSRFGIVNHGRLPLPFTTATSDGGDFSPEKQARECTVRFDDRLTTVLEQPAAAAHERAIRWRQLVELVARSPGDCDPGLVHSALEQIREERPSIDERVRVATALAIASLPLPADLVAIFAADELTVAAPILAGARLTAMEWKRVSAASSADCRAFISAMRADETHPAEARAPAISPSDADGSIPSISEVVARIERLRQLRDGDSPASSNPPEAARLFRWECNEAGEIDWVEGAPRGALVGHSIAQRSAGGGVDRKVERAFASRAPFHEGVLELPHDAVAGGTWKISGIPAFERTTGRFAGYRGVAERAAVGMARTDPTSLRELAHEIKTPLNAIIGFAEIITGEYLGPADSSYRERAAEIVAQARLLLSAIEDLDFAARVQSGSGAEKSCVHLGTLTERLVGKLREGATERGVIIEASRTTADLTAAADPEIAERLILRMCDAVIARASPGEKLRLGVEQENSHCTIWISRPSATAGLADEELFGRSDDALSDGFALRLARGLAHSAGVEMAVSASCVSLAFPRA
jgi:hypothetical protein